MSPVRLIYSVGAMLIAEEALEEESIALLSSAITRQPSWSAVPIIVLTMGGKETTQSRRQARLRLPLGDTGLLERPIRVATLVSSVKSAPDARNRQYERRLAETLLRQSEKLAAVGRLASSIAHEINNPLESLTIFSTFSMARR
jgi:signal transduction histidine kinase